MTTQLDPWKQVGVASKLSLPGFWSELSGRPVAGDLTDGEDPAELPEVSVSLTAALDRFSTSIPSGWPVAWTDVIGRLPLDPRLDANLTETSAEQALHSDLRFLRQVCDKPRLHLRAEEQREMVGRVRRITPRTVQHLAAHSEDWHARTFRGVRPGRLLAQVTEDDWALYENRVAVTLQRHLVPALQRRVDEIDALRDQLAAIEELNDFSRGSRFKRARLSALLGRAFSEPPSAESLRQVYGRLQGLLVAVRQLGGSDLLRKARDFAPVRPPLLSTNVFREDDAYRHVAHLWRQWIEDTAQPPPTEEELIERRRKRIQAHRHLALVLVVRALEEMRMIHSEAPPKDKQGGRLHLHRGWRLRVESTGLICIEKDGQLRAEILPLARGCRGVAPEQLRALEEIAAKRCRVPLLCLWLEATQERLPGIEQGGYAIRHVSTSPQRLDSIEGPLRFLREIVYREEWPIVPVKVALSAAAAVEARERGLLGNQGSLAQPPDKRRMEKLHRDAEKASSAVRTAEAEMRQIEDALKRAPLGSRDAHFAKEERQRLQQRLDEAGREQSKLSSLREEMNRATGAFSFAQRCPCCPETRPAEIVSVRFRCVSCGTEWGRNHASGNIFIRPKDAQSAADDDGRWGADWIGVAN